MKVAALRIALWLALIAIAFSQSFEPNQLMLLVIGRSANRPDGDQKALLNHVQNLRNGLPELQVATMHFDRPREAAFARQVLGVSAQQLPAVCLVQLDSKGQKPVRSLYCWPKVTGARLAQVDQMADRWAMMARQPMPMITPQMAPNYPERGGPPEPVQPVSYQTYPSYQPPPPSHPVVPEAREKVFAGVNLLTDSWLRSKNGRFACCFQNDGNLVVYSLASQPMKPLWNSQTQNQGAAVMRLGSDGVLRMLSAAGNVVWQAGRSSFFSHCFMCMQDDGNLVIYRQDGNGLSVDWATNTDGLVP